MYSEKTEIVDVKDISPVVLFEQILANKGTYSTYKYYKLDDAAKALFTIADNGSATIKDSEHYVLYIGDTKKEWSDYSFGESDNFGGFVLYAASGYEPTENSKLEIRDARIYSLSMKAGDMYESALSGTLIRRHDVGSSGTVNFVYVGLSEVKKDSNGFTFTFANGDVYEAPDADSYPCASSVSDKQDAPIPVLTYYSNTSSGGQLKIGSTSGDSTKKADWEKIKSALANGLPVVVVVSGLPLSVIGLKTAVASYTLTASVVIPYNGSNALRTVYTEPSL